MWKDVSREAMFHHCLWFPPQDLCPWHRTAGTGRNITKKIKVLKFTNSKVITVIATALNVVKFVSHVELFTECEVGSPPKLHNGDHVDKFSIRMNIH